MRTALLNHRFPRRVLCLFLCVAPLFAFEEATPGNQVILRTDTAWTGTPIPAQSIPHPEVTLVRIKIPPKTSLPVHQHKLINVAYVVSGTLRVKTQSGKTVVLKAGDAINEVMNTLHFGENIGDTPVELLVFYVGEKGTPLSELKIP